MPDACVDALWLSTGPLWVCGPETTAWTFELPPGVSAVGVRFRPGIAPQVSGVTAVEIAERRVRWGDLFGPSSEAALAGRIAATVGIVERIDVLQDAVASLVAVRSVEPDPIAEAVLALLARRPRARAGEIATTVGLTSRQLHRRSVASFGYGMATLARIVRFHRVWSLVESAPRGTSLARLAAAAGYSDHAHLVRDCRAITGLSPRAFFAEAFPTFPDMSDPFKTAPLVGATMAS